MQTPTEEMETLPGSRFWQNPARLRIFFWCLAIVLGFLQAWARRFDVNQDAVCYLDIGNAYFRGDWAVAINGYWSPLFSWTLGLALWIFRPSPYWESTVAHLANFVLFLFAFWCFEFFFREVTASRRNGNSDGSAAEEAGFSQVSWMAFGYVLFLYSSLEWIGLRYIWPDTLMTAFLYLAAGLLVRARRAPTKIVPYVLLGAVLGVGYLAKTPMFVLAFFFLAACAISSTPKKTIPRTALAFVVFFVIAAPHIVAISQIKGRFTFGESVASNYTVRLPILSRLIGTPAPPKVQKRIFTSPAVYSYEGPANVTYPVWLDPTGWGRESVTGEARSGERPEDRPNWRVNLEDFYLLFKEQGAPITALLALLLLSGAGWRVWKDLFGNWFVLLPAAAGIAMFVVAYVRPRYVAGLTVIIWLGLISGVRLLRVDWQRRAAACVLLAAALALTLGLAKSAGSSLSLIVASKGNDYWKVADGLRQMGLKAGDRVALASYLRTVYWARLGPYPIVAEVNLGDTAKFLSASPEVAEGVRKAIAETGARAIVTDVDPTRHSALPWRRIGDTEYYAVILAPE